VDPPGYEPSAKESRLGAAGEDRQRPGDSCQRLAGQALGPL